MFTILDCGIPTYVSLVSGTYYIMAPRGRLLKTKTPPPPLLLVKSYRYNKNKNSL